MKKLHLIVLIFVIIVLLIFLLIKINTTIYIGDYTGKTRYSFDIKMKIDDKEILNDSLISSFPYLPNFKIITKLKYGLHTINIYSDKANVSQKEKIFLLPNQHIFIEFFPADTLTLYHYNFPDSVIVNGIQLSDSIIEQYKLPKEFDYDVIMEKSKFFIESRFNPFYLE